MTHRLGRFLSADPFVQFPSHTQSFNRYAYVLNNPLRYTDPSGHFVFSFGAAIWIAAKGAVEWYIAAAVFGAAGFADALLQGASINDALTAGVFSGVSGAAFSAIAANPGWFGGDRFLQAAAFGTVGGITSTLRGGKFGHGFLAAGLGAAVSATGLTDGLDAFGRTMTAAILGGTVSEITGGKFANGAAYAAFASLVSSAVRAVGDAQSGTGEQGNTESEYYEGDNETILGYSEQVLDELSDQGINTDMYSTDQVTKWATGRPCGNDICDIRTFDSLKVAKANIGDGRGMLNAYYYDKRIIMYKGAFSRVISAVRLDFGWTQVKYSGYTAGLWTAGHEYGHYLGYGELRANAYGRGVVGF